MFEDYDKIDFNFVHFLKNPEGEMDSNVDGKNVTGEYKVMKLLMVIEQYIGE